MKYVEIELSKLKKPCPFITETGRLEMLKGAEKK